MLDEPPNDKPKPAAAEGSEEAESAVKAEKSAEVAEKAGKTDDENLRHRVQGALGDVVRRTVGASLGAVFSTEEGIRKLVSDFSLPKDVANFVVSQAQGTRDEIFRAVAAEFGKWLDRMDLQHEMTKVLSNMTIELKTEVRFVPSTSEAGDATLKPEVKAAVKVDSNT